MPLDENAPRSVVRSAFVLVPSLLVIMGLDYLYINDKHVNNDSLVEMLIIRFLIWLALIAFAISAWAFLNSEPIRRGRYQPVFEFLFCLIACSPWLCCSYCFGCDVVFADSPEAAIGAMQNSIQVLWDGSLVVVFLASVVACAWIKMGGQQSELLEAGVAEYQRAWRARTALAVGLLATFSLEYSAAILFLVLAAEGGLYGKTSRLEFAWKAFCLLITVFLAFVFAWVSDQNNPGNYGFLTTTIVAVVMIPVFFLLWILWIREVLPALLHVNGPACLTLVFVCMALTSLAMVIQSRPVWGPTSFVVASYILLDGVASPLSEYLPSLLAVNGPQEDATRGGLPAEAERMNKGRDDLT